MAVPDGRNGLRDGEDEDGLFVEEGEAWVDTDADVSPHHRALATAAETGDAHALRLALDNSPGSIDNPVEDGDTVLHLACLYGHFPCVQLLVERGASLEVKDEEGAIPLHDACAGGFVEIVHFMLNACGNPDSVKQMLNAADAEGDTPLHHAARGEHLDVVNLLLSVGASSKKTNIYGKVPFELADIGTEVRRLLEVSATSDPTAFQ